MTDAGQLPGDPGIADAGILEQRLTHLPTAQFAEHYWAQQALLTRGAGDFADLLSAAAVDELVSARGLRTPFLRVAKDGQTLPESSFTAPGGIGAGISDQLDDTALWRHFADGATLVLQALHRTWAPVADFAGELGAELGHPVQANAYITPPQNRGFDDHYDVHDVFVLQIAGTKRWVIHEPVHPDPLRDQPWTDRRAEVGRAAAAEPAIDAVLEPGDVLYLPRGWLHAAQAQGDVSIHLTLGVHVWTRYALAEQLAQDALRRLREQPQARGTLPLGATDVAAQADAVRDLLVQAVRDADAAPAYHRVSRGQARPAALGPLAQLAALRALQPATAVRLRGRLGERLTGDRLETRVGWLDLDATELAGVRLLLDHRAHRADEIGLEVARRLLRAGVLLADGS